MSQKIGYLCTALGVLAAILLGDYISYRMILNEVDGLWAAYEERVSDLVEVEVTTQLEDTAQEVVTRLWEQEQEESVSTNASEDTLTVDTVYEIQQYDALAETTVTDYETLPQKLVGCTRQEADAYCTAYMENLAAEEYLDGLQSMGVVSFSVERLVVKKIYDSSQVAYRYYLIAINGEVVVYYGDKKTVYEYTGIETSNLTQEEKSALKQGIEVEDEETLYSILENYSS